MYTLLLNIILVGGYSPPSYLWHHYAKVGKEGLLTVAGKNCEEQYLLSSPWSLSRSYRLRIEIVQEEDI
jgi:hypothetical protein